MPELPFIQVLVENLAREIEGHTIVSVRVPSPAIVKTFDPPVSALAGRRIERVRRIGKLIVSDLSDDLLLVMHLMRDGRLQIARAGSAARKGRASPAPKPMAFGLFLEGGDELRVNEAGPKKRAGVYVLRAQDAASSEPLAGLGPDPLSEQFTADVLARAVQAPSSAMSWASGTLSRMRSCGKPSCRRLRRPRVSPATRWPGCTPPSGAYLLPRCRSTGPVLERSCQRASRLSCSACTGTGASRARAAAHASKQSTLPIRKPTIARRVRPAARFTLIDGCRDC